RGSSREPKISSSQHSSNPSAASHSFVEKPSVTPPPASQSPAPKLPPSASGRLISDTKKPGTTSSKALKASITGGMPMKGKSTALSDLEVVIRNLEIQTNPSLAPTAEENARRRCSCMATRHELVAA